MKSGMKKHKAAEQPGVSRGDPAGAPGEAPGWLVAKLAEALAPRLGLALLGGDFDMPTTILSATSHEIRKRNDLHLFATAGMLRLRISDFDPKGLKRDILFFPASVIAGDKWHLPDAMGTADPQPPLFLHPDNMATHRTRWDMDAAQRMKPVQQGQAPDREKLLVHVVLDDPQLGFLPGTSPLLAANQMSTQVFFNLESGVNPDGKPFAMFWTIRDSNPNHPKVGSFNIALLVQENGGSGFSVPIIIDPSVRNRG